MIPSRETLDMMYAELDDLDVSLTTIERMKELIIAIKSGEIGEYVIPTRMQFTAFDQNILPEFNNKDYLEYETIKSGLSEAICSYGYRLNGKWIKLELAYALSKRIGKGDDNAKT